MSSNGPEGSSVPPAPPKQQQNPSSDPASGDPQQQQYAGSSMQRLPPGARTWSSGNSMEESQPPPQGLMSPPVGVPAHYSQQPPPPPQQPQTYSHPSGAGSSATAYWPTQHSPNSRFAGYPMPPGHLGGMPGQSYPLPPHLYSGQQHLKPTAGEWPPKSNGGGSQGQPFPQMDSNASTSTHPAAPQLQSPSSRTGTEDDDSKQGFHSPPFPQTPTSHHRQMVQQQQAQPVPTPSHMLPPPTAHMAYPPSGTEQAGQLKPAQREAIDKLVAGIEDPARRMFFERLVLLNEKHGEVLSAAPQVSKTPVDLYHLYVSCMQGGGFEQVTKDKAWKNLCPKANPSMQESSAAGYQLRRHYQKYLLSLECLETGQNAEALVAFADKMKKKKKEKEHPNTPAGSSSSGSKHHSQKTSTPHSAAPGMPLTFAVPQGAQGGGIPPGEFAANPYYYQQGPPAWASQHASAYPGHPAAYTGMRLPPGIRPPMGELTEEQQRQQQQFFHHHQQQQQAAYAAHIQQQQAMAAAQHQQMQQQQASCSNLQPPDTSRTSSSTTPIPFPATMPVAAGGSRASSTGPPPQTQTPDSASRMSAGNSEELSQQQQQQQTRPPSQQPPTSRHTPTPSYSYAANANAPTPPLTTSVPSMLGQPTPTSVPPYYSSMPPFGAIRPATASHSAAKSPYGVGAVPSGYSQQNVSSSANSELVYPPPSIGYPQSGMWMHSQRFPPPPAAADPFVASKGQPPTPQLSHPTSTDQQRRQQQTVPPTVFYPPSASTGLLNQTAAAAAHSPGSAHRSRQSHASAVASNATPSHLINRSAFPGQSPYGHVLPQLPAHLAPSTSAYNAGAMAGPAAYPPGSVEATTSNPSILKRKRPKVFARDLTMATPKRILMAMRSGLTLETIWAINVLNVQLYDDSMPHFQSELVPDLLNVVIEHLLSVLSLLFPDQFKIRECKWTLNGTESAENTPPNCIGSLLAEFSQSKNLELKEGVKAAVRPPIGRQSATKLNFSRISRTGRPVKEKVEEMPDVLKKLAPLGLPVDATHSEQDGLSKPPTGVYVGLAERVRHNLVISAQKQWELQKPAFNKKLFNSQPNKRLCLDANTNSLATKEEEDQGPLFYRSAKPKEQWDRFATPNCSLISRATSLYEQDDVLVELVNRCLALSNIIRGFSFIPGNEKILSKHIGLLRLLGKLMRLFADDDDVQPHLFGGKEVPLTALASGKKEEERMELETKQHFLHKNQPIVSDVAAMFLMKTSELKPLCPPEEDGPERLLLDTANHLREDAFVVLAHVSVQLDLFDMESEVSYTIFDALLHWAVSTNLQARDPLLPGIISPRNYALEILCKMSVIERNVDLMLSTGPWPRLEEFVRVLCSMIGSGEEIPSREFAIVILNAVCAASEPACYVAAVETPVLTQLVSFLELADSNMHQFVQMQGMQALRENPEMMGTSVGMLRRATLIMVHIARHENCRRYFVKLQNRLLQFTVSHFMDSRVAAMVAEILFEMQRSENFVTKSERPDASEPTSNYQQPSSPLRINSAASSLQDDETRLSTIAGARFLPKMTAKNSLPTAHINGTPSISQDSHFMKMSNELSQKHSSDYLFNQPDDHTNNLEESQSLRSLTNQHPPLSSCCKLPTNTNVSEAVKEILRNNIKEGKKGKHLLNGAKINGKRSPTALSNNNDTGKLARSNDGNKVNHHAESNSTTKTSSSPTEGSLTAVA